MSFSSKKKYIAKRLNSLSKTELEEIICQINIDENIEFLSEFRNQIISKNAFIKELISYISRQDNFEEIVEIIQDKNSNLFKYSISEYLNANDIGVTAFEIDNLRDDIDQISIDIIDVKQEIDEVIENESSQELIDKLKFIYENLDKAARKADELSAPVYLPQDMKIQLVRSDLLEHLDEYRSDENKAYLLIGIFSGIESGILVNWVTDENFTITRPSLVLIILFAILLGVSLAWVFQLYRRTNRLKRKMFPLSSENIPIVQEKSQF